MVKNTFCFFVPMPVVAHLNGALSVRCIFCFVLEIEFSARAQPGGIGRVGGGGGGVLFEIFSWGVLLNFLNPDATSKKDMKFSGTIGQKNKKKFICSNLKDFYGSTNKEKGEFENMHGLMKNIQ